LDPKIGMNKRLKINISKKEKTLFLVLFAILFLWVLYYFVFIDQLNRIESLKARKVNYETQLSIMKQMIEDEDLIKNEREILKSTIEDISCKYFYNINQPYLLHILNSMLENEDLEVNNISFSEPMPIDYEGLNEVYSIGILLPFKGDYNSLISFLKDLRNSDKRLLIDYISISRNGEDGLVSGQISLKAFSYGNIKATDNEYYYINAYKNNGKEDPFKVFDGYEEENKEVIIHDSYEEKEKRDLIFDMEADDIYFMGTSHYVSGQVKRIDKAKHGNSSIRTEYNISTVFQKERAYVVLDDKSIIIKYPPQSIGLWAYSYGYSPVIIGIRLSDMDGRKIELELSKSVDWMGWKFISAIPPQDLNIYPLKLDRIYLELDVNREEYGVILFDQIEASYGNDREVDSTKIEKYSFYIVKPGDTLKSISKSYYNTESYFMKLAKENALNPNNELEPGTVLVIPK